MLSPNKKQKTDLDQQDDALGFYLNSMLGKKNTITPPSSHSKKNIENETPVWATENIRCLTVTIAGLTILIPAMMISDIRNVTNNLIPSTHMPSWVYEFSDDEDVNIQVINTRKLIFDGLKSQRLNLDLPVYAILIDDGAWGIACDSVGKIVTLKSQNIAWRGRSSTRRWLSGTSSEHNAIIFDVRHIEKVLVRFL